ncbi:MAG: hypothetical protein IIC80_00415 [Chloroflexi bacterium]|nr:hypothetical protein [Chloroflexota bacterium]
METGNVAALFTVQGKHPTQAEWEAALDANWDDAVEELRSNPGFKGIVALWNSDDSGEVEFRATVLSEDTEVWRLIPKKFSLQPNRVVRCTYAWRAPKDGHYDFLGEFRQKGRTLPMGRDTGSPHGGVDARFSVGSPAKSPMDPWTDAPESLERGSRTLERSMAAPGTTALWFESSLVKIFPNDVPVARGAANPTHTLVMARGERESFQIVIRPPEGTDLGTVSLRVHDLHDPASGYVIPASHIRVAKVGYVPVRVPTHFESPTGLYPDPLPPFEPFEAKGGQCHPLWFTVYAPYGTPAGIYEGPIDIAYANGDPVELSLRVEVLPFDLPTKLLHRDDPSPVPAAQLKHSSRHEAIQIHAIQASPLRPQEEYSQPRQLQPAHDTAR